MFTGTVLVIDEFNEFRNLVKQTLHAIGHRDVKIVNTKDEGLDILNKNGFEYNLVISSIDPEESSTIDFINKIPLYVQIQSIFVHNEDESQFISELSNDIPGLNTLKKPFAKSDLERAIENIAKKRLSLSRANMLYRPLHQDSRILVIDDFETMRQLMRNAFIDLGYFNIDDAINGVEASVLIKKAFHENDPYQLIFCDWNMPEMNGLELLMNLQNDYLLKGAPFIMVTAENEKNQVINAINAGVDDYIVKPLNPKTLQKKLNKINVNLQNKIDDNPEKIVV